MTYFCSGISHSFNDTIIGLFHAYLIFLVERSSTVAVV